MLKNKKSLLITISLLIVAIMGASVAAYTLAGSGKGASEDIKKDVEPIAASLEGNLGFMEYVSNIDLIIEDSKAADYKYQIVHMVPSTYQGTSSVTQYVADDIFRTKVINAHKEGTDEMAAGKIAVTVLNVSQDVKTDTAFGDSTVGALLGNADLLYIESPTYESYRGLLSDDLYSYLVNTYIGTKHKPIIVDYVTETSASTDENVNKRTYKKFINEVADNYIYSPVFAWPTGQTAADFFAGNGDSHFFQMSLTEKSDGTTKGNGKVLVLEGTTTTGDSIHTNFIKDNIPLIYYGKEEFMPADFTITHLDVSTITSADQLYGYDFIIIEDSAMTVEITDDTVYNALDVMATGTQYMIFGAANIVVETNSELGNNYAELLNKITTSEGDGRYHYVLSVQKQKDTAGVEKTFFDGEARTDEGATKIAELINGANYRDSETNGRNGKKFRVLELQPCYPIDLDRATNTGRADMSASSYASGMGLTGNYYQLPGEMNMGKTIDEVGETDDYYAFELSKAKIAKATGLKFNQIQVDQMSTEEFISSKEVVIDTYDLVYIGGNVSALTPYNMYIDFSGNYASLGGDQDLRVFMQHKYVAAFTMFTHTGIAAHLQSYGSYVGSGNAGPSYGTFGSSENEYPKTSTILNGNDITQTKLTELINYIDAGMPIIFSKDVTTAFEKIYNVSRLEQLTSTDIDPDSNMYKVFDHAYQMYAPEKYTATGIAAPSGYNNIVWGFDHTSERGVTDFYNNEGNIFNKDVKTDYVTLFPEGSDANTQIYDVIQNSATRPSLQISQSPRDYNRGDISTYNKKQDNQMLITTNVIAMPDAQVNTTYRIVLYVDEDGDGTFDEDEIALDPQGNKSIKDVTVPASTDGAKGTSESVTLSYSFPMDDFYGLVSWKLVATLVGTDGLAKPCDVRTGYAYYVREEEVEKKDVRLLQLMPIRTSTEVKTDLGSQDLHTLYMCTECQMAAYRANYNLYNGKSDVYYHTTGSYANSPRNNMYMGLHEHKFGIVSYDSSIAPVTPADAKYNNGSENWNLNLADELYQDYNFDLNIMMLDEYHKTSWITEANTKADGTDRLMSDTTGLPAFAAGEETAGANYRKDETGVEITPMDGVTWIEYYEQKRDMFYEEYEAALAKLESSGIEEKLNNHLTALKTLIDDNTGYAGNIGVVTDASIDKWIEHKAYYNYYLFFLGYENLDAGNAFYADWVAYNALYQQWVTAHDDVVKYKKLYTEYSCYASRNMDWLDSNYDMLVLGFAADFGGNDLTIAECNAIKDYITVDGGSVLLTHDSTTRYKSAGSVNLTNELRKTFGLDRFHATVDTVKSTLKTVTDRTSHDVYLKVNNKLYGPVYLTNKDVTIKVVLEEPSLLAFNGSTVVYDVASFEYGDTVNLNESFDVKFEVYDNMADYTAGTKSTQNIDYSIISSTQWGLDGYKGGGTINGTGECYANNIFKLEATTVDHLRLPFFTFDDPKYFMTTKSIFSTAADEIEDKIVWQSAVASHTNTGNGGSHFNVINLVGTTDSVGIFETASHLSSPYRYVEYNLNNSISYSKGVEYKVEDMGGTRKASQLNKGIITTYPFNIGEDLDIAPTHAQTLATDLEDSNMVVWYTLAGSDTAGVVGGTSTSAKLATSLYAATPYDGMDNYFLYTFKSGEGTVHYCGAGHSVVTGPGKNNNDERMLYINLVVDSVRNTSSKPKVTVLDTDNKKVTEESTGKLKLDADGKYVYNVENITEIPKFNFQVKFSSLTTLEEVYMFYDLNYGTPNGDYSNKYKNDFNHVLIHHYKPDFNEKATIEDAEGNREEVQHSTLNTDLSRVDALVRDKYFMNNTHDMLQLNIATKAMLNPAYTGSDKNATIDYFAPYGNYTYIVIWAKDAQGKTAYARIKINLTQKLFDLTQNTSYKVFGYHTVSSRRMDITDRIKFNI